MRGRICSSFRTWSRPLARHLDGWLPARIGAAVRTVDARCSMTLQSEAVIVAQKQGSDVQSPVPILNSSAWVAV